MNMDLQEMKERAALCAADELVLSGMRLGLGTGSTAVFVVRRVGAKLAAGELNSIRVFATSFQTELECEKLNIPHYGLNAPELGGDLDLTIDGADEIDPENRLIKGGGGALLIEKLAAYNSGRFVIVADESKLVPHLALAFPLPVEVIPEARCAVSRALEKLGAAVSLREALRKAGPVITEHGNLILDIRFREPVEPEELERRINRIPGVVENGFFTGPHSGWIRPRVYIGRGDGSVETRDWQSVARDGKEALI
ncbi:MAG: ribose-5-phosphate isomerase RpiA [Treponema sp.]|jgi:ribose 5-phosphate isomerase A|nr:ribose-5-phosphate isomerase RpiA [Treponema sp.]